MNAIDFWKAAIKDPRVGALAASSKFVASRIARELKPEYKYIIEYGAGDGAITKGILRRLSRDGKLVAVEVHKDLVKEIKKIDDPRLAVLDRDVVEVSRDLKNLGLPRIDAVVSGVPLSFFSPSSRREIVNNTHGALAPGGTFIVYQHSFLVLSLMKEIFGSARLSFEPRNLLPYFLMIAEK